MNPTVSSIINVCVDALTMKARTFIKKVVVIKLHMIPNCHVSNVADSLFKELSLIHI